MKTRSLFFDEREAENTIAGRKTAHRELIRPYISTIWDAAAPISAPDGRLLTMAFFNSSRPNTHVQKIPPMIPGDTVCIRETWRVGAWRSESSLIAFDFQAGNFAQKKWIKIENQRTFRRLVEESIRDAKKAGYKEDERGQFTWEPGTAPTRWRASAQLPMAAARIWGAVTAVEAQRLQRADITQMQQEGFQRGLDLCGGLIHTEAEDFRAYWTETWITNPWTWRYSFTTTDNEKDAKLIAQDHIR